MSERFVVLTGGPGSGKTTLVEALQRRGHAHSVEAGRAIIKDQLAIGGRALPWAEREAFAELMLAWEMRSYAIAQKEHGLVFFDRGIPDVVGYLRLSNLPVPAHADRAAKLFRYNVRVFVAPPWPDIFRHDAERKQDFEEAVRTYEVMVRTYREYGYQVVEIPRAPIEERLLFVMSNSDTKA